MRRREDGFSYLIAMLLVALVSVLAVRGTQITLTQERREKEAQLLDAGVIGCPACIHPGAPDSSAIPATRRAGDHRVRDQGNDPIGWPAGDAPMPASRRLGRPISGVNIAMNKMFIYRKYFAIFDHYAIS